MELHNKYEDKQYIHIELHNKYEGKNNTYTWNYTQ